MEAFFGLVRRLVSGFDSAGLNYMFTGALAASFYGVPRTTVDIDVVVEVVDSGLMGKLASALRSAGVVFDEREVDRALRSGYRIARFRDGETAYRVDVIFSEGKLERRAGKVAGVEAFFQAPEDLVLAKLRMIRATVPRERALKDVEDVRAVLEFAHVDVDDLKKRARKEGTLAELEGLLSQAG